MMKKLMLALSLLTVVGLQAADMSVDEVHVNDQVVYRQPETLEQRALKQLYKNWLEKEENHNKPIYYNLCYFEVLERVGSDNLLTGMHLIKNKKGVISFTHAEVQNIVNYGNRRVKNLSINNIIERRRMPAVSDLGILSLKNKNISSLDGLQRLPLDSTRDPNFKDNRLTEIKEEVFIKLDSLSYLRLNNNQIREGAFVGLTNLKNVSLCGNKDVRIEGGLGNLSGVIVERDNS